MMHVFARVTAAVADSIFHDIFVQEVRLCVESVLEKQPHEDLHVARYFKNYNLS